MSLMNRLFRAVRQGSIEAGRTRARQHLLGRGDRFLADNGFSRELLERGNRAWPWRIDEPVVPVSVRTPPAFGPSGSGTPFAHAGASPITPIVGIERDAPTGSTSPDRNREAA